MAQAGVFLREWVVMGANQIRPVIMRMNGVPEIHLIF